MKIMKTGLITLVALGSLVAFGPTATAKEKKADKAEARAGKGAAIKERFEQIAEELKLSAEQKEKIRPILAEELKKVKELRADSSASKEDKQARLREIRKETAEKVKPILTTEQLEQWQKLREERRGGQRKN